MKSNSSIPFGINFEEGLTDGVTPTYDYEDHTNGLTMNDLMTMGNDVSLIGGTGTGTRGNRDQ